MKERISKILNTLEEYYPEMIQDPDTVPYELYTELRRVLNMVDEIDRDISKIEMIMLQLKNRLNNEN